MKKIVFTFLIFSNFRIAIFAQGGVRIEGEIVFKIHTE